MKRNILFLLFILLLFSSFAKGSGDLFLEGMRAFIHEEYSIAVQRFDEVIARRGEYVFDAHHYQILSLFQLQDFQGARKATDNLHKMGYESPLINLEWGKIYMNVDGIWDQPDVEMGQEALRRAKEQGLSTGELYGLLGDVYYYLGEMDVALTHYQRAIVKEPVNAFYHSSIARIYQDLNMMEKAIYHMEWSIGIDSDQPGLMTVLANIYYEKGFIKDFMRIYGSIINKFPDRFSFRQEYGIRLYEVGLYEEAKVELKEGIHLNPKTYLPYYYLGLIFKEEGDREKAMEHLEEALYYNPQYTDAVLSLGDLVMEESPFRALSLYYEAKELSPLYAPVYYALGVAYNELGFQSTAIENLQQALRIDPNHEEAFNLLQEIL